jgi:drug efflux transport system permease protein
MISLVTLVALIRKEFLQALRDRRMMAMLLAVPCIQLVMFGYAANLEINHIDTMAVDLDHSEQSRALLSGLEADGTFRMRSTSEVPEAERALREGTSSLAIVVPRGFGRGLVGGEAVHVQVLVDGSDPYRGVGASGAVEQYIMQLGTAVVAERLATSGLPPIARIRLEPRLLYNPALRSRRFMVPGTAASILLIITTIVTAMGLAREREMGTMEQLSVTPISPLTLMIGKIVPYGAFGFIDELIILVLGNLLFDVPLRGNVLVIFVSTVSYLTATLGVGLLISTVSKTQQQALMGGFFVILPAMLLSGFMTPIEAMPSWVRPVTYVNPMRYFVEIVRSVLLRGATLQDVAKPLALLTLLAVAVMTAATLRFRKQVG